MNHNLLEETKNVFQNVQFEASLQADGQLKAMVLAVLTNNEGKYLIMKRAEEHDKDEWDLPGGSIESEDLEFEMQKEIREETGGEAKNLEFVFSYDGYNPEFDKTYRYFVFKGDIAHEVELDHEHSDFTFVDANEAFDTLFWEGHKKAVRYVDAERVT